MSQMDAKSLSDIRVQGLNEGQPGLDDDFRFPEKKVGWLGTILEIVEGGAESKTGGNGDPRRDLRVLRCSRGRGADKCWTLVGVVEV